MERNLRSLTLRTAETELSAFVEFTPASVPGYPEGLARRQETVDEARRELAEVTSGTDELVTVVESSNEVRETFERMPVPVRRRLLAAGLKRVTVRAGRGPVEKKVEIEFTERARLEQRAV